MALTMHTLSKKTSSKSRKRIGRGYGSSKGGHTVGRGMKGQKSRSGSSGHKRRGMRRLVLATPKLRGFKSYRPDAQVVSLSTLDDKYIANEVVSPKTLIKKGLIRNATVPVKILANGKITKSITVKQCHVSQAALEKITEAGGKAEV